MIGLTGSRSRQGNDCGDETAGIAAPRRAATQGVAIKRRENGVIAAAHKAAARSEHVSEGIVPIFDFRAPRRH